MSSGGSTWATATRQITGRRRRNAMQGPEQQIAKLTVRLSRFRDSMIAPLQRMKPRLDGTPAHSEKIRRLLTEYGNASTYLKVKNIDDAALALFRVEKGFPEIVDVFDKETLEIRKRLAALVSDVPKARLAASQPDSDPEGDGVVTSAEEALTAAQDAFGDASVTYTAVRALLATAEGAARTAFLVTKGLASAVRTIEELAAIPAANVNAGIETVVKRTVLESITDELDFWGEDRIKEAAALAKFKPGVLSEAVIDKEYLAIIADAKKRMGRLRDPGVSNADQARNDINRLNELLHRISVKKQEIITSYSQTVDRKLRQSLSMKMNALSDIDITLRLFVQKLSKAGEIGDTERDRLIEQRRRVLAEKMPEIKRMIASLSDPDGTSCVDGHAEMLARLLSKDDVTAQVILEEEHDASAVANLLGRVNVKIVDKIVEPVIAAHIDNHDYLDELTAKMLIADIRKEADVSATLRGNSAATKFATKYSLMTDEGRDYVADSLTGVASDWADLDVSGPHGLEIDPTKMGGAEVAPEVLEKHRELVESAINSITTAVPPPVVTKACATIYDEYLERLREKYAEDDSVSDRDLQQQALKMVGGQVILRVIVPQMVTLPIPPGREAEKDELERAGRIQGKILQNISNQLTTFVKEPFMGAFADLAVNPDGDPAEANVALQEYFRQIVREGKKAQGGDVGVPLTAVEARTLRDNWKLAWDAATQAFTTIAGGMQATGRPRSIRIARVVERIGNDLPDALNSTLGTLVSIRETDPVDAEDIYTAISMARLDISELRKYLHSVSVQISAIEEYPASGKVEIMNPLKAAIEAVLNNLP